MNILKPPFGGGHIVHMGSSEDAVEHQRVISARGKFSLQYMKEKGWGDDPIKLSIQQIMEIREQPEWKKP
jgi:hypothetical protein